MGLYAVPFVLLVVSYSTIYPFMVGRNLTFRIIIEVLFGAWVLLVLRDRSFLPKRSSLFIAVTVFVGIMGLADILGVDRYMSIWSTHERMEGLLMLGHLFAYLIVASSVFRTRELWDRFFYCTIGVSIFSFFYGILQAIGDVPILSEGDRIEATFGNATHLGGYALLSIFLALFLFWRSSRHDSRGVLTSYMIGCGVYLLLFLQLLADTSITIRLSTVLILFASIAMLVFCIRARHRKNLYDSPTIYYVLHGLIVLMQVMVVYYSGTRGAILGVVVGSTVTGLLIFWRSSGRRLKIFALAIVLVLLGSIVCLYTLRNSDFVSGNHMFSKIERIALKEDIQKRFLVWDIAWQGVKERPLLGWGQENFDVVFDKYYDSRLPNDEPWFDRAHNIVMDILVAGGFLGLIAYASIFVLLTRSLWKDSKNEWSVVEKALLTSLLAGYVVHNLFVFDSIGTHIIFFSLVGYILSCTGSEREFQSTFYFGKLLEGKKQFVVVGMVLGLAWYLNAGSYFAARDLARALAYSGGDDPVRSIEIFESVFEDRSPGTYFARNILANHAIQHLTSGISEQDRETFLNFCVAEIKKNISDHPGRALPVYNLGELYEKMGKYSEAVEYLKRADSISPNRPTVLTELGITLIEQGEYGAASRILKHVLEITPRYDQAALAFAAAEQYIGEEDLAEKTLIRYIGTNLDTNQVLLLAYDKTGRSDLIVKSWELSIAEEPAITGYWVYYAAAALKAKDREKSEFAIREFMKRDPELQEIGSELLAKLKTGIFPNSLEPYRGY